MPRMGRPRTKHRDMPPGMMEVSGRWYWRPTDTASRAVCEQLSPGKKSVPAGKDKAEARKWWARHVLPLLDAQEAPSADDTVGAIINAYLTSPQFLKLAEQTRRDYRRGLKELAERWGTVRYARSADEASRGEFLRRMHIAGFLDSAEAKVAANRKIAALSSAFKVAIRSGCTEYNPCQGVERNTEVPRSQLVHHSDYAKLKHAAPPVLRIAMLIARLTGMREGDLLVFQRTWIRNGEIHVTPSKTERTSGIKQRIRITPSLERVLNAARTLRGSVRSLYVIHTQHGQPYTQSGFQSMWQRTLKKAGVRGIHFHDLKANAVTEKERKQPGAGSDLAGHVDPKTTRKTYRRGAVKVSPVR